MWLRNAIFLEGLGLATALWGLKVAAAEYNPLSDADFCYRHSHQTAVLGNRLYIDGGFINIRDRQTDPTNYTMQHLLVHDLTNDAASLPPLAQAYKKPANVPSVIGGQLWPDKANGKLFMFGGEFQNNSQNARPTIPDPAVWEFDTWNNSWSKLETTFKDLDRPSFGAGVAVEHEGYAYYLGGWVGPMNQPGKAKREAENGMLIYDMVANTWRKNSGPKGLPRVEGVMVYIPTGDSGVLVSFGGLLVNNTSGKTRAAPMDEIQVFDVVSETWFSQKATGEIPDNRRLFCAGAASAQDGSSHNIYLYGGAAPSGTSPGFGDVYILTLPAFHWIRWWPTDNSTTLAPHNLLTCNVVNNFEMLIIGGYFPSPDAACDIPRGFGVHNMDMGAYNRDKTLWFGYSASLSTYFVPQSVLDVVGGTPNGGAVKREPNGGFDKGNGNLKTLFTRSFKPNQRMPTRVPTVAGEKQKTGLAAGLAAGIGIPIVAGIVGVGYFFWRRGKNAQGREKKNSMMVGNSGYLGYGGVNGVNVMAFQLPTTQSPRIEHQSQLNGSGVSGKMVELAFYNPGLDSPRFANFGGYNGAGCRQTTIQELPGAEYDFADGERKGLGTAFSKYHKQQPPNELDGGPHRHQAGIVEEGEDKQKKGVFEKEKKEEEAETGKKNVLAVYNFRELPDTPESITDGFEYTAALGHDSLGAMTPLSPPPVTGVAPDHQKSGLGITSSVHGPLKPRDKDLKRKNSREIRFPSNSSAAFVDIEQSTSASPSKSRSGSRRRSGSQIREMESGLDVFPPLPVGRTGVPLSAGSVLRTQVAQGTPVKIRRADTMPDSRSSGGRDSGGREDETSVVKRMGSEGDLLKSDGRDR